MRRGMVEKSIVDGGYYAIFFLPLVARIELHPGVPRGCLNHINAVCGARISVRG